MKRFSVAVLSNEAVLEAVLSIASDFAAVFMRKQMKRFFGI